MNKERYQNPIVKIMDNVPESWQLITYNKLNRYNLTAARFVLDKCQKEQRRELVFKYGEIMEQLNKAITTPLRYDWEFALSELIYCYTLLCFPAKRHGHRLINIFETLELNERADKVKIKISADFYKLFIKAVNV